MDLGYLVDFVSRRVRVLTAVKKTFLSMGTKFKFYSRKLLTLSANLENLGLATRFDFSTNAPRI